MQDSQVKKLNGKNADSGQPSETKNFKLNEEDASKDDSGFYDMYTNKVKKANAKNKQKAHPMPAAKENTKLKAPTALGPNDLSALSNLSPKDGM